MVEKFAPSLERVFSLRFEEGNIGCAGIRAGCPGTPWAGGVQKVCAETFVLFFRPLNALESAGPKGGADESADKSALGVALLQK